MTQHLKLTLHITEPWNFDSITGRSELSGWTLDHESVDSEEWEMTLDEGFDFHNHRYARLLVSARYVGEHLTRIFDAFTGFPVRVAHKTHDGGWHYSYAGMLSVRREEAKKAGPGPVKEV